MYSNKSVKRTVLSGASFEDDLGINVESKNKQNHKNVEDKGAEVNGKHYGMSTKMALARLHDEIEKILKQHELKWQKER